MRRPLLEPPTSSVMLLGHRSNQIYQNNVSLAWGSDAKMAKSTNNGEMVIRTPWAVLHTLSWVSQSSRGLETDRLLGPTLWVSHSVSLGWVLRIHFQVTLMLLIWRLHLENSFQEVIGEQHAFEGIQYRPDMLNLDCTIESSGELRKILMLLSFQYLQGCSH